MKIVLSVLTLILFIISAVQMYADELDIDESTSSTMGTKRGVKRNKLKVANLENLKVVLFDNKKDLQNFDQVASGQQFYFNLKALKNSFYYIFVLDTSNKVFKIHSLKNNAIQSNEEIQLPEDNEAYEFDDNPGVEQIFIFLSTEKNEVLEDLSRKISEDGSLANNEIVNKLNNKDNQLKLDIKSGKSLAKRIILIHKNKTNEPADSNILERANQIKNNGF